MSNPSHASSGLNHLHCISHSEPVPSGAVVWAHVLRTFLIQVDLIRHGYHTGDKVIVLAEDDDTYRPVEKLPDISEDLDSNPEWKNRARKERVLFIGWRRDMHDMISVLDQFVAPGSELFLYNEVTPIFPACERGHSSGAC